MASVIDKQLAISLIQEYQAQNSAPGGPGIITPDGEFLQGYFVDRESIESVLSEPDYVGLSLYLAIAPGYSGTGENIFTIMFTGAALNPAGSTPYTSTGDIYEFVGTCPPYCNDL